MSRKPKASKTPIAAAISPAAPQRPIAVIPSFDTLPDSAFIREAHLVQSYKRPDVPAPVPFSSATLWRKVKAGDFPKPVKLGQRITAWRVGDVRKWIDTQSALATSRAF